MDQQIPLEQPRSPPPPEMQPEEQERQQHTDQESFCLYISGLKSHVDDRMLEHIFSPYGRIVQHRVVTDPHTRESRGFGFVHLDSQEHAQAAIDALHGKVVEDCNLSVQFARRNRPRTPTPGKYMGTERERGGPGRDRGDRDRDRDRGDRDRSDRDRSDRDRALIHSIPSPVLPRYYEAPRDRDSRSFDDRRRYEDDRHRPEEHRRYDERRYDEHRRYENEHRRDPRPTDRRSPPRYH
ncbi:putative RNA-binding protein [Paratrimastix pyriformis]|uniref:RNA-binding protein n=1 Tax=Paratrimastix pyriformis TaxID=342808 RepID=A0ABQ8U7G9_9EUKA|nr:putative RNA-binding protein [Paratrimastix pyriformis]